MFYSKELTQAAFFVIVVCSAGCSQPLPLQRPTSPSSLLPGTPQTTAVSLQQTVVVDVTVTEASVLPTIGVVSPTVTMTAVVTPTTLAGTPIVVVPPTEQALSAEAVWQAQQVNRQDFGEERPYTATVPASLFWFDPATGQSLEVGQVVGRFIATAQFELRSQNNASALAVPYRIDQDYGLTAISPAVKVRMQAAGYLDRVEAYILIGDAVAPVAAVYTLEQVSHITRGILVSS